jgi:hypothetical protein
MLVKIVFGVAIGADSFKTLANAGAFARLQFLRVANLAWRQIFREILKGRAVFDPPIPGGLKRLAIRA